MRTIDEIKAAIEHGRLRRRRANITPEEKAYAIEQGLMTGQTLTAEDREYCKANHLGSGMRKRENRTHDEIAACIERNRVQRSRRNYLTPEERAYAKKAGLYATKYGPAKPLYRRPERNVPLTDAQRALVESSTEFVRKVVMKRLRKAHRFVEYDDLFQVAMLAVCAASQRYDPSQGATFNTFASMRADFAMTDYLREQGWGHRKGDSDAKVQYTVRSLDAPLEGQEKPPEISSASFHPELETTIALEQFAERVYPIAGKVIRGLAEGKPIHRVAVEHGIPPGSAWNVLERLKMFYADEIRELVTS